MSDSRLANPVWHALSGSQAGFARRHGRVLRFPADIAPFVAVEDPEAVDADELAAAVQPGEVVDFVAVAPRPALLAQLGWSVSGPERIARMQVTRAAPVAPGPPIELLGPGDGAAMLALTRLVYPGYFRARTHELGTYLGIRDAAGQLAAMAGERMRIGEWQEISAVCTHPDQLGRGHAQRLVATLVAAILQRGQRPFLHVSLQNTRAIGVYQQLGFELAAEIELWLATRPA